MRIAPVSTHPLEGVFWGTYSGFCFSTWNGALADRQRLDHLSVRSADKSEKIWAANRKLFVESSALSSSVSMIALWAHNACYLSLGKYLKLVKVLTCIGSGVTSFSSLSNGVYTLAQKFKECLYAKDPCIRNNIMQDGLQTLLKIAFNSCLLAWSVLGVAAACYGGEALLLLMDDCFLYAVVLFLSNLGFGLLRYVVESPRATCT